MSSSNASTFTYGTMSGSTYGFSLAPEKTEQAPKTPGGLFVTRAVQTRDGWLGQVIVDKEIVWESSPEEDGEDAVLSANRCVVEVFKEMFRRLTSASGSGEVTVAPTEG